MVEISRNLKREAVTCSDLFHKIQVKKMKLDDGSMVVTESSDDYTSQKMIQQLPAIIGYMRDDLIFKLLLHEVNWILLPWFSSDTLTPQNFLDSKA